MGACDALQWMQVSDLVYWHSLKTENSGELITHDRGCVEESPK